MKRSVYLTAIRRAARYALFRDAHCTTPGTHGGVHSVLVETLAAGMRRRQQLMIHSLLM
jgi:hypothetical protein